MRSILLIIVILVVVLLFLGVAVLLLVNRIGRARFRKEVAADGHSYTADDPAMLERFQAPPFGLGGEKRAYDVVRGQRDGRSFSYWTQDWWASRALPQSGRDRSLGDKHAIAVAAVDLDGQRPVLDIVTHRMGDDEFVPIGQQLPDHPGLPGVSIFGDDPAYAAQVLTDDLVARIAAQPVEDRINLRVAEGAAIAWSDPANKGSAEWRDIVDAAQVLATRA
ncbi:hypothetical protein CGZ95_15295 [Enemella evansiae]|uniref:hypothetical protein n=1 Tax=Enemella evansiae TaxID=2016499 RepID=UPI000B9737E0|nr:hypothetical protein [Enemella evansiae]OYN97354.1 hypothetical protein CGZ95_15295 [Enemella evansiae]